MTLKNLPSLSLFIPFPLSVSGEGSTNASLSHLSTQSHLDAISTVVRHFGGPRAASRFEDRYGAVALEGGRLHSNVVNHDFKHDRNSSTGSQSDIEDMISVQSSSSSVFGPSYVRDSVSHPLTSTGGTMMKLSDAEKMLLSVEYITRILKREGWSTIAAIKQLENTLEWRREQRLDDVEGLTVELVDESHCGKSVLYSYDSSGRPLLFITPSKDNTEAGEKQVRHSVFVIERAFDLMVSGVEELVLIVDLGGSIKRGPKSIGVMRSIIAHLQVHYRERVSKVYLNNVGFFARTLIACLWPFVDSSVKSKIAIDVKMENEPGLHKSLLPTHCGGDLPFKHTSPDYWQAMTSSCISRRQDDQKRWLALGGHVGIAEADFKQSA